ncbi:MAG: peptide chain release factor N(5)-glutamine methyltransferase [Bacillota bacterium]
MKTKTAREVLREMQNELAQFGIENAKQEAEILFFHCMHWSKTQYIQNETTEISEVNLHQLDAFLLERKNRKPLQYILGQWEFMGLPFSVGEGVLIPRQDTELLVETILSFEKEFHKIEAEAEAGAVAVAVTGLDLGTGSGCIPISLAHHGKFQMSAVDISATALTYSQKNAVALGVDIAFYEGDLFGGLPQSQKNTFSFIVSNPPYIRSDIIPTLMEEVKDFEPTLALDGGADGLLFYERIIDEAPQWLCKGGWLFFEIGHDQGEDVFRLMEQRGFSRCEVKKDLNGLDRVVLGQFLNKLS